MAAVWVTAPGLGWRLRSVRGCSVAGDVLERLTRDTGVFYDFYVVCNGRVVDREEQLQDGSIYRLEPRLRGGKGGFGSMLRALGAQIEKTTNREACRDLSGRRLRDVNHEKEMAEWLKKQSEREAEKEQRRLERLQKKLAEPKHHFTDSHYQQQCHELSERLEDSVLKGLQASSSSVVKAETSKRPSSGDTEGPETKRSRDAAFSWTGLDLLSSDEDLEEEEESEGRGAWSEPSSRSSSEHSPPQSEDQTGPRKTRSSPESSSSPEEDQRDPQTSCRPEEDQRDPQTSCRPEEDQRDPQTSCRPEEDQRDPQTSCRPEEDQRDPQTSCRPEEDQRDPESSCRPEEDQRDPQTSCRPEEDQRDPESSCRPEEDQRDPQTSCRPEEDQRDPQTSCRPEEDQDSPQLGLDLDSVSSPAQLEALGLDVLKEELTRRGLKCGGTLSERAARLFSVRGKRPEEVDPALLAKKNRKQK